MWLKEGTNSTGLPYYLKVCSPKYVHKVIRQATHLLSCFCLSRGHTFKLEFALLTLKHHADHNLGQEPEV